MRRLTEAIQVDIAALDSGAMVCLARDGFRGAGLTREILRVRLSDPLNPLVEGSSSFLGCHLYLCHSNIVLERSNAVNR
jgi:hypothetical protein